MQELSDHELLAQFARDNSQAAFTALVSRHVNLVYSVALRKTGNPQAAEEITQAAFIILARKAGSLPRRTVVPGWLCETARLTAANYLRTEFRRQKREQEAQMESIETPPADDAWKPIIPLLDDALARLGVPERDAVVLRFFENKSLRDVGAALGISEDAAKRRVHRALEKLRKIFTRRGVTLSAAVLGAVLAVNSVQAAPAALAATVSTAAVQGSAAAGSTLALVKGALKLMAWTKAKTAVVAGVAVVLAAGTTMVVVKAVQTTPAPDLTGAWEGSVEIAEAQGILRGEKARNRIVFTFSQTNGVYGAAAELIDESPDRFQATAITYDYPSLRLTSGSIMSFEATLAPNGTEISGTFQLEQRSFPLSLKRTSNPDKPFLPLVEGDFTPRPDSDLQGYWQENWTNGREPKLALKIAESASGTFRAELDNETTGWIHQPVLVTFKPPKVTLLVATRAGMFEGELRDSNTVMTGNWVQGGNRSPVTFNRAQLPPEVIAGIGATLGFDEPTQTVRITKTIPDSPAAGAGLPSGFIIQKIDGVSTAGRKLADCVNLIRGQPGTKVTLELASPDGSEIKSVELTRRLVKISR